mgnify:CR=1 FL=1
MQLSVNDIEKLRNNKLLTLDENAIKEGDVIIAVNVVTGARRLVEASSLLLEAIRKILHG